MSALNAAKEFMRANDAISLLHRLKDAAKAPVVIGVEEKWILDWTMRLVDKERMRIRAVLHKYERKGK